LLRPLDFTPQPDTPVRKLFAPDVIAADLDRLAGQQHADGGWPLEWQASSPAAGLEWRGYVTVLAIQILKANARI
jgi:hypothetical protein